MIKLAMEGKCLRWTKNNESIETEPYKGNIIMNVNVPIMDSVIDRCYLNKTIMNREMTLDFIDYFLEGKDINRFVNFVRQRIEDSTRFELTKEEVDYVGNFTKEHIKDSDQELGYSRRCILKMLMYFKCAKKLFGKLDKEVLEFIEPFAELYIINNNTPSLVNAIVSDGEIDKAELIRKVADAGGYSERNARRLVDRELQEGKLILRGRLVKKK